MQPVDLLLDLRVNDTLADIFVDGVIGEAQIVLVSQATETVSRGLEQEFLRQSQLRTQRNDLLRGVHTDGGESAGGVAVNRAVAHPVLGEIGSVQHDAAVLALGDGVQRQHPHPGGQVYRSLTARLHAQTGHLIQDPLRAAVDVEHIVADTQKFHQTVGIVDIRLNAVGHQYAYNVFLAVGRHGQCRHGGAVFAAGDADDSRFAAAGFHLLPHPVQQTGQLFFCVKFHEITLPKIMMPYSTAGISCFQELFSGLDVLSEIPTKSAGNSRRVSPAFASFAAF